MLSKLGAKLPIMSTFFGASSSPKETGTEMPTDQNKSTTATTASPPLATHNASSSDTDARSPKEKSSKPSSEKESTLVDEPIRDSTAPEDTNAETTSENQAPEVIPNEDANQESVGKNETEKEAAKDEDKSSSEDDAENKTDEPEPEYPTALRLVLITIALCLCVFCTALVCCPHASPQPSLSNFIARSPSSQWDRTTQSSQQPSPKSPINSIRSTMSVGMEVPTCSRLVPSP